MLSFQVWVQCDNTVPDKRIATAWILLRKKPSYGYDSATYKRKEFIQDSCFFGFFRELNPSEYYINPLVGFIGLKINVPENYAVAVTYETYDGKKYGEGKYETNGNETMILKMIKCPNQSPDATPRAWELKMKNVYRLPINYINQFNFRLSVKYLYNEIHTDTIYQYYLDTIPTTSWPIKQMLSIDRYTGTARRWNPDGIFDFIEGRTIISETGDIIFPTLKPFSEGLSKAGLDSNYIFNELYERRKSDAQISHKANYYFLKGYSQGNKY
ncbi:MAG: hypothetical protein HY959_08385 [Ignavibacteriae bacterium]|nr:hypothetical protein [Ignavibacteriota bacterium]